MSRLIFKDSDGHLRWLDPNEASYTVRHPNPDPENNRIITLSKVDGVWLMFETVDECLGSIYSEKTYENHVLPSPPSVLSPERALDFLLAWGEEPPAELASVLQARRFVPTKPVAPSVVAFDRSTGKEVVLFTEDALEMVLEDGEEGWEPWEGHPTYLIQRTLYRLADGRWFLVEERFDCAADRGCGKEVRRVSDQEAAELLLSSGYKPPPDLVRFVEDRIIAAQTGKAPDGPEQAINPSITADSPRRAGMSQDEANVRARDYLMRNANREGTDNPVTVRELAREIPCATGLVSQLPAWRAVMEQREKRRPGRAPKALKLSEPVLESTGNPDEELARLVAEQRADWEASPLDEGGRSHIVHKKV